MSSVETLDSYHHGDLRNALIAAAVRAIEQHGPGGITIRGLAREVGVSRTAPYRHFDSLAEILVEVGRQGFERLAETMQAALNASPQDAEARVVALGCAYVEFAVAHPVHFRVMFGDGIDDDDIRRRLLASGLATFGLLLEAVQALQKEGLLKPGYVMDQAIPAWSMIHGFATLVANKLIPAGDSAGTSIRAHVSQMNKLFLRGAGE